MHGLRGLEEVSVDREARAPLARDIGIFVLGDPEPQSWGDSKTLWLLELSNCTGSLRWNKLFNL